MPETTMSVRATCTNSPYTEIKSKNHSWNIDEPAIFGGQNAAPSPVEMLLGSLAGCICASGHLLAEEMGVLLTGMQVEVDGTIDSQRFLGISEEGRTGFRKISVRVEADANWTPEQKDGWLHKVFDRCPVVDNLTLSTALDISFV